MSMTFTKLFSSITESTIWTEPDTVRLVWITMLAMADSRGRVWASIPGLANRARVSVEDCESAINRFMSPDKYSRTPDFEGRRLEIIDGGWRLLNHSKYRAIRDEEAIKEAKRKHINTKRAVEKENNISTVDRSRHNAEAEADAEAENKKNTYGDSCKEIITYLNQKAGTSFRNVKSNDDFIIARLKEGATMDDLRAVIDLKCKDWIGKPEAKYLRPETLFNATKFNSYVGLSSVKQGEKKWI